MNLRLLEYLTTDITHSKLSKTYGFSDGIQFAFFSVFSGILFPRNILLLLILLILITWPMMDQNIHPFQTQNSEQLKFNVEEFGSQTAFEKAVDPFFHDTTKWLVILVPPGCHKLLSFLRFHLQSQRHDGTSQKHVIIVVQLLRNSVSKWNVIFSVQNAL